jgi:IS5 family transposase
MQQTFSELEYAGKKKLTRRDRFLHDLDTLTPWPLLEAEIKPYYADNSGGRGRPAIGLSRMLRMYVVQQCFGLSDEGTEDSVYDSQAVRTFVGVDLSRESAPDATTLLKFRRLLEQHQLTQKLFARINQHLSDKGLMLKEGTIVDATLIAAPPSTKNKDKARDPEMHQSKKGNQWHFGMKAHIGVDAASGLVHSLVTTSGHVHDVTQTHALLHGEETAVFGDAGYVGVNKREENKGTPVDWHIAMRPGKRKALPETPEGKLREQLEYLKAKIRAKVEHPFHVVKNRFHHRKTRYRGLAKNTAQMFSLFGWANLLLAKRYLMPVSGINPS